MSNMDATLFSFDIVSNIFLIKQVSENILQEPQVTTNFIL